MHEAVVNETDAANRITDLERRLAAAAKVNAVLMQRIEQRDATLGSAGSMLEQNLMLERVVAKKTHELEAERQELRRALTNLQNTQALLLQAQKMESIGQLAAGMAHEINTPIQYVTDNVKFVRRCFDPVMTITDSIADMISQWRRGESGALPAEECEALLKRVKFDYIKRNVPAALEQSLEGLQRVASIVAAMKDFSHPSADEKEPADLGDIIKVATTVARNEWKYVAELDIAVAPDLPKVPCLRDEIGQVVMNLVVNAAHAVGDVVKAGGSEGKGRISISARLADGMAEIRVRDSGTGIAEPIRNRVFDPFFSTKPVGRGTGQGLAICYMLIVEKHQGKIYFETEMGKGTTFIVRLPLEDAVHKEALCA